MISVVIPARNAAATIATTLSSLVPDRALIGEILLIDDGSTDGTVVRAMDVAAAYALPLAVTSVRVGSAGAARNVGLEKASGDCVFFLDADDEVISGGLSLLRDALGANPQAGLAIGASIHRASTTDKLKVPGSFGDDRNENVRRYLANALRSITVGSALVTSAGTAGVRFPESIGLDEDTLYWAKVLMQASVTTIAKPVLFYNLDETRMARRFVSDPRRVFLDIALELNKLKVLGIGKQTLQRRKAFIALRIARYLIRHRRYTEAVDMMRAARAHGSLRHGLKTLQYMARIRKGLKSGRAARPVALAGGSPRTLVLTVDPACPPVSGADLRNFQNAAAAAELGPVALVSVHPGGNDLRQPDKRFQVISLHVADERPTRAVTRRTAKLESRISSAMLGRLLDIIRNFRPDVVLIEGIPLFAVLKHIRPLAPSLILDMHNIESDLAAQLSPDRRRRGLFSAFQRNHAACIHRIEQVALSLVDRVWVCSDHDRERLLRQFDVRIPVDVIPNSIPRLFEIPASLKPLPSHEGGFPVMIFVGHLGYAPNVEAAERLALNILPRVMQAFPTARLVLAGRLPKPRVEELARLDRVELLANPADLSLIFRRGHLSVIPLAAGGGTRIKILEAMAWGLPVVATPLAAEGHGLIEGDEIEIALTDEALSRTIIALCSDLERLARQRQAAHRRVMRDFGHEATSHAVRSGLGLDDG